MRSWKYYLEKLNSSRVPEGAHFKVTTTMHRERIKMIVYPAAETAYEEMKLMSDPRTSEDDSDDDFTDTYEDNS